MLLHASGVIYKKKTKKNNVALFMLEMFEKTSIAEHSSIRSHVKKTDKKTITVHFDAI